MRSWVARKNEPLPGSGLRGALIQRWKSSGPVGSSAVGWALRVIMALHSKRPRERLGTPGVRKPYRQMASVFVSVWSREKMDSLSRVASA